jgi:hypothetical protein
MQCEAIVEKDWTVRQCKNAAKYTTGWGTFCHAHKYSKWHYYMTRRAQGRVAVAKVRGPSFAPTWATSISKSEFCPKNWFLLSSETLYSN